MTDLARLTVVIANWGTPDLTIRSAKAAIIPTSICAYIPMPMKTDATRAPTRPVANTVRAASGSERFFT
jgi:hypothetical protein